MWHADEIAHWAMRALRNEADRLTAEQAWHGIDTLSEVQLHPILARGLSRAGWGVVREQPYPTPPAAGVAYRDRQRCDLVLTTAPGRAVGDPVQVLIERDRLAQTLFADVLSPRDEPDDVVPPDRACWVEVKAVGQFACCAGVPGPNARYASELIACRADLVKLASDPRIRWGVLLIVLMGQEQIGCERDLIALGHASLDDGIALGDPAIVVEPIPDHIGNSACAVGVLPLACGTAGLGDRGARGASADPTRPAWPS